MKPLPYIELENIYGCLHISEEDRIFTLDQILNGIEKEQNPVLVKEQILALVQMYFDSLINCGNMTFFNQEKVLSNLLNAGKKAVGSFYRGNGIDNETKDLILSNAKDISELINTYGLHTNKERNLANESKNVALLGRVFQPNADNLEFDIIIPVASGGFEPSFLLADILEKDLHPIRCSPLRHDLYVHMPLPNALNKIKDKNVLVVEDTLVTGYTLSAILVNLNKLNPNMLYVAVAFAAPERYLNSSKLNDKFSKIISYGEWQPKIMAAKK